MLFDTESYKNVINYNWIQKKYLCWQQNLYSQKF